MEEKNRTNIPQNIDDSKITREELRNLLKAMDKEGFDKIMEDYMKEISDPNNVKETNEYLKNAENTKDLPHNVKLAQPKVGFCVKSSKFNTKRSSQRQKVFINICSYVNVVPPSQDPQNPSMWSLPHLLNKGRNDQDKKGNICTTYDVVFHPEAIKFAKDNLSFKKFVCDTAINGINSNLLKADNEKVSSDYIIKTKIDYKGAEVAYINVHSLSQKEFDSRREPSDNYKTSIQKEIDKIKSETAVNEDNQESFYNRLDASVPEVVISEHHDSKPEKPVYKIKYSDLVELTKYFYDPGNKVEGPLYQKLVIELKVPKLDNINIAELELDKKKLVFKYKDMYDLSVDLPVEVDKDKSEAKFDRKQGLLTISAVIVRKHVETLPVQEDENIEIVKDEDNKEILEDSKLQTDVNTLLDDKNLSNNTIANKEDNQLKPKEETAMPQVKPNETNNDKGENIQREETKQIKDESQNTTIADIDKANKDLSTQRPANIEVNKTPMVTEQPKKIREIEFKPSLVSEVQTDQIDEEDDVQQNVQTTKFGEQKQDVNKLYFFNFNCNLIYEID